MPARAMTLLCLAAALMCGSCDDKSPRASGKTVAAEDALAPDVQLTLHDGTKLELSSLRGNLVLLYFYPKDDTPG